MTEINVQFNGIAFSDPSFPLQGDINGTFSCKQEDTPLDRKSYVYRSKPNVAVSRFIRFIEGQPPGVYYQAVMELTNSQNATVLVFQGQQTNLPVANVEQYGGMANRVP